MVKGGKREKKRIVKTKGMLFCEGGMFLEDIFKRKQVKIISSVVLSMFVLLMSLTECVAYAREQYVNEVPECQSGRLLHYIRICCGKMDFYLKDRGIYMI